MYVVKFKCKKLIENGPNERIMCTMKMAMGLCNKLDWFDASFIVCSKKINFQAQYLKSFSNCAISCKSCTLQHMLLQRSSSKTLSKFNR